jgi:DNA-binding LacI/PurR family transcriptional regulator
VLKLPSIKDVAKRAGVGIATVSRVINNSGYVKNETRKKVEEVIRELNFHPNEIARSMTKQRSGIVAFIIPNSIHLFFAQLIYHFEGELYNYGFKLMVCNSSEQIEKEISYLDMLRQNKVDAVVLLTNNDIERYFEKGMAVISFDRHFEGIPVLSSDNYKGGVLAANRLIDAGCKHLMFIGDDAQGDYIRVSTEVSKRRIGFIEQAKKRGVTDVTILEYPLGDYIRIPEYVHDNVAMHPEVDGIFCVSDAVAADVIRHLEKRGIRVPEDVRVIGFDGGDSFINLGKRITSIRQNTEALAKDLASMILSYRDNKVVTNRIVPVTLIEGETA